MVPFSLNLFACLICKEKVNGVTNLKVVSATFLVVCFSSLNESTCQTRKNVFYFTPKALFVLEKIKFQNFRFSNFMAPSNA